MKEIIFEKTSLFGDSSEYVNFPEPSSKFIPNWYKETPLFLNEEKDYGLAINNNKSSNLTIKGCSPFLDSLNFGYMYSLPIDIEVRKDSDQISFRWRMDGEFITDHTKDQHPLLPNAFNTKNNFFVLKWAFPFSITTPPGYSCFFTHPINRHELPFRTFSGVVDTDTYHLPVQFPFQFLLEEDGTFIIEKGTPLCQIIPFKRDEWISKKNNIDEKKYKKIVFEHFSKIVRSYKNQHWKKKKFI